MTKFDQTIKTYNQYAGQFAAHFERKLDPAELDEFLKLVKKGGYLLDAGCGSARDSAYMLTQGFSVLGIDFSAGLLVEAKKLHPQVSTQQMSLLDLELSDAEFDGIWCKATLLHIDRLDIPKVLSEFYRVLKPGGQLFIQTKSGTGEGYQPSPFDATVTRYFSFFSLVEMTEMLRIAGFRINKSYEFNGLKRNAKSRDQDWLVFFAQKEF